MTYLNIHAVRLTVYDLGDTDLRDLDATGQAGTSEKKVSLSLRSSDAFHIRVTIKNRAFSDPLSASLE